MGGVRMICRGIDDFSNCGNFVETETILSTKMHIFSFVQIRGSIPLFWQQAQKGLVSEIEILRTYRMTEHVFKGHLCELLESYRKILMINLVKKHKPDEEKLMRGLVQMLKVVKGFAEQEDKEMQGDDDKTTTDRQLVNQNVKHIWFDFHAETSGDNFHRLNYLMEEISDIQNKFGFYVAERGKKKRVLQYQRGIFRTNCIDCLDRTNVTQMKICSNAVQSIVQLLRKIQLQERENKNLSSRQVYLKAMHQFDDQVDQQDNQVQT